ncbi:MAG: transglycosylase family protein, partial [Candidatus Dormiibacterota bacterium]
AGVRPRLRRATGLRVRIPFRVSRRLGELAVGVAILPLGLALTVGLSAAPPSRSAPPVAGLASSLLRFHVLPLTSGWSSTEVTVAPPVLDILPAAPPLSRLAPAAAPKIPSTTYPPGSVEAIITAAADAHGVSPSWMISTAACESGLRPTAYNPSGPYYGLFQFLMSTFKAHGGTNIWDPTQQSEIAASMFASGDSVAWPVCSRT